MILLDGAAGQLSKLGAGPISTVDDDPDQFSQPVHTGFKIFPYALEQGSRSVGELRDRGSDRCRRTKYATEMRLIPVEPLLPAPDRPVIHGDCFGIAFDGGLDDLDGVMLEWHQKIRQFTVKPTAFPADQAADAQASADSFRIDAEPDATVSMLQHSAADRTGN
jgi:hypothetical protein